MRRIVTDTHYNPYCRTPPLSVKHFANGAREAPFLSEPRGKSSPHFQTHPSTLSLKHVNSTDIDGEPPPPPRPSCASPPGSQAQRSSWTLPLSRHRGPR